MDITQIDLSADIMNMGRYLTLGHIGENEN